jgi:hypothetical protein
MRRVATAAGLLALALPGAAQGATDYFNGSNSNGALAHATAHTIQRLEIYCSGKTFEKRALTYSMSRQIHIGKKRKFSYKGIAYEYGPERQPYGEQDVKLSGSVNKARTRLKIKYSLPDCAAKTVFVPAGL